MLRGSAEQIFESFLCPEADGQAADAQTRKSGRDIDAESAKHDQGDDDKNGNLEHTAPKRYDGTLGHPSAKGEAGGDTLVHFAQFHVFVQAPTLSNFAVGKTQNRPC